MNPQFKLKLLRYWLAMNYSGLQAGAHSVRAFLGVAGAHAVVPHISALTLQQLGGVFAVAFLAEIFNYLGAHPVSFLQLAPEPSVVAVAAVCDRRPNGADTAPLQPTPNPEPKESHEK